MKYVRAIFALIAIWVTIHLTYTIIDGLRDNGRPADAALILGTKVNEDGTLSARLAKRLDCGLNLYKTGRVKKLVVSGGLGKEGFYEGDKMRDYLVQNGVSDTNIIVDNNGNNTLLSVKNILQLKDSMHFKSLIVVSQYYHLTRSKMLFRKQGFNQVQSASPKYFEVRDIYSLFREFVAYYKELL
jgi:vancomycin permeability regulator SanA